MKRLAIITTHPIQYNAPLFSLLTDRKNLTIKVFYTWGETVLTSKYDPGFGKKINWDIPLLNGYDYTFVKNIAREKGSHHFRGINNPTIIKEISNWLPDFILVFGWSYKSHLNVLKYFNKKTPIVFRGDSTLLDKQSSLKTLFKNIFLKYVYSKTDNALYVGTENKKYFEKFGVRNKKLFFAPHAVDNDRFKKDSINIKIDWREKLHIHPQDLVFLFAGKIEKKKDPEILIKAFVSIKNDSTHLVIAGNGILEDDLKNKYKAVKNLHFIDFQNQSLMPSVYQLCDVFVLPSIGPNETWGLAVNEAMATGKAIIVSNAVGCAPDLVEENINGYVFIAGDVNKLIEKMNHFVEDKGLAKEMGKKSEEIIKKWSFTAIASQIETLVNEAQT